MGESENYLFFGNYCSIRSQSIKGQGHFLTLVKGHSDFKVKCLTLACILRCAIQGLMVLLFALVCKFVVTILRFPNNMTWIRM